MKSEKLRQWMLSTSSSVLLINGNCLSTTARSPITFVCARLVDSLKAIKPFIVIHFFCGEHIAAATDENASPTAMMNSLLSQLLMQYPDFEISSHDLAEISDNTLDNIARLLAKLFAQLPPTVMLFCIVDGISLYEDTDRLQDTKKVMQELAALIEDQGLGGPIFKLMLTSATRIKYPPVDISTENSLLIPRHVPPQAQFSSSKWESHVENDLIRSQSEQV